MGSMGKDGKGSGFTNLRELEGLAREEVDRSAFDYIAGGSGDETTLTGNETGWQRYRLLHRVLKDVEQRDLSTTVCGRSIEAPVLVAPTAFHRLVHPEGEVATARGAQRAGVPMVASTLSTTALEDIAQAAGDPRFFQLYVYKDRKLTKRLVDRAEAAGYEALFVTVDSPVWGKRERDIENDFALPEGMGLANFPDMDQESLPEGEGNSLAAYVERQLDPSLSWEAIDWLTERTDLPVVVKGLVHPDDARRAADHGVDGIVVSNHGGRQLDSGVPTALALPDVAEAAGDDVDVLVDGGVRRGTDVVKALALGADAVLVGRPVLWALAVDGADGVHEALSLLRYEVDNAMALAGARTVDDVTADLVQRVASGEDQG